MYWGAFASKSEQQLSSLYEPDAVVFGSFSTRREAAPVAMVRRRREYFSADTALRVNVGDIDVRLIGAAAVATYTFTFTATNVGGRRSKANEVIQHGRATQVFQIEGERLHIVHEHLSVAACVT